MVKRERTVFTGNSAVAVDENGEIHQGKNENSRIIIENVIEVGDKHAHLKGERYVKLYDVVVPEMLKKLSPTEITFVLAISPYVSYEDCIIRKGKSRKCDIATGKELSELLGMDYVKVRRLLSSLINKGVIGRHETGTILDDYFGKRSTAYTVNPYIYFRGMDIRHPIAELYKNSGWKELYDKTDSIIGETMSENAV